MYISFFFRRAHFVSHAEGNRHVSPDDNDVMIYNRVSCNLMGDPDIQNALYKSASAENLPKNKSLPVSYVSLGSRICNPSTHFRTAEDNTIIT